MAPNSKYKLNGAPPDDDWCKCLSFSSEFILSVPALGEVGLFRLIVEPERSRIHVPPLYGSFKTLGAHKASGDTNMWVKTVPESGYGEERKASKAEGTEESQARSQNET